MFSGCIVAMITPMKEDGSLDKKSINRLVDYHIQSGTSAIVTVGSTGESATLTHNERLDVIRCVVDYADGRIPIIAGVSASSTADAVCFTKKVEVIGVDGCLSVTPYYSRPTQEGLFLHYKALADSCALPQILYNVPTRTGCDLLPSTVGRLAKISNIVAVKEATGDLKRVYALRRLVGDSFSLLSGDDVTFLDFIILGGNGTISVTANIAASQMATICSLALHFQFELARKMNDELLSLHEALFIEPNPCPVKWVAAQLGLTQTSALRLPLTLLSEAGRVILAKALKRTKLA